MSSIVQSCDWTNIQVTQAMTGIRQIVGPVGVVRFLGFREMDERQWKVSVPALLIQMHQQFLRDPLFRALEVLEQRRVESAARCLSKNQPGP
jgi:hypothetical protein